MTATNTSHTEQCCCCLVSNYSNLENNTSTDHQQQQPQQQQQQHHQQQQQQQQQEFPTMRRPIHKVSTSKVEMVRTNRTTKRKVSFYEFAKVREILSRYSYSEEEREACWFNRQDVYRFKANVRAFKRAKRALDALDHLEMSFSKHKHGELL